jgi:hypothetical protein
MAVLVRTYGDPNGRCTAGAYGQPRVSVGPDGGAQLVHMGSHGHLWILMGGAQLVRTGSHGHLWVLTAVQLGTYG